MNSSPIAWGCALLLSAAGAACGSLAQNAGPDSGAPGAGVHAAEQDGAGPILAGTGKPCVQRAVELAAIKISANVSWQATGGHNGGRGLYDIWLLTKYAIDAQNNVHATNRFRAFAPPAVVLGIGDTLATDVPCPGRETQITSPVEEWDRVTKTSQSSGVLGGWNVGSSISMDPSVSLFGLKDTSAYKDAATPWPVGGDPFGKSPDYESEEGDGRPGVAFVPVSCPDCAVVRATIACGAPAGSRLFVALRIELSLYGTNLSCTEVSGTATVPLLDTRIVGCDLGGDGGPCTPSQTAFLDSDYPDYTVGAAAYHQVMLPGETATCADVLASF